MENTEAFKAIQQHDALLMGWAKGSNKLVFFKAYDEKTRAAELPGDLETLEAAKVAWRLSAAEALPLSGVEEEALDMLKEIAGDVDLLEELADSGYDVTALLAGEDWRHE